MLVYVNHETGTVDQITSADKAVLVEAPDGSYSDQYFTEGDYADDPFAAVILLPLEAEDDEVPPSFDEVEAAGFDGTMREDQVGESWKSLALAMIEQRKNAKVAGFMDKQPPVTLPPESVFYVRAMVARGIKAVEDNIQEMAELAAKDTDAPAWAVESLQNATAYQQQLLREVRQYIPTSFQ